MLELESPAPEKSNPNELKQLIIGMSTDGDLNGDFERVCTGQWKKRAYKRASAALTTCIFSSEVYDPG